MWFVLSVGPGANSSDEHDIISIGPRSPAHEDALELAQEYAAHVTESAARLRNSRRYAASVTQDARRAMLFEQHGLNRPIPQGPELQARLRSARERASVSGDTSGAGADFSAGSPGLRRGACSPPPRREIPPASATSLRTDRLLASGPIDSRDAAVRLRDLSSIQRPLFINTTTDSSRTSYSPRDSSQAESVIEAWGNSIRHSLPSPLASVSGVNRTVCEHSPNSGICPRGTGRLSSPGGTSNSILRTRLNAAQDSSSLPSGSSSHSSAQKTGPVVIFGREESAIWRPSTSASTSQNSTSPSQEHDSITSAKNICSSSLDSRQPTQPVTSHCLVSSSGSSIVTEVSCGSSVTTVTSSQTPCSAVASGPSSVVSNGTAVTRSFRDIFNSAVVTPSTTVYSTCVSCVHAPVASVSSVQAPVAISGIQDNLETVSQVQTSISPSTASSMSSGNSTAIPAQVPGGIPGSAEGVVNTDSLGRSFLPMGSWHSSNRIGSSPRSPPPSRLPSEPFPRSGVESQTRPAPDLSLLGFRRIPSEALLATSVLPSVDIRPTEIMEEDVEESNPQLPANQSVTFDCDSQRPEPSGSAETVQTTVSASGSRNSSRGDTNPDLQHTYATRLTYDPQTPVLSGSDANDEHVSISNMTSRLAQEINVLGRMIAMRERFSVRLQALQNERNEAMANSSGSQGSSSPGRIPEITITEHQVEPQVPVVSSTDQSGELLRKLIK